MLANGCRWYIYGYTILEQTVRDYNIEFMNENLKN